MIFLPLAAACLLGMFALPVLATRELVRVRARWSERHEWPLRGRLRGRYRLAQAWGWVVSGALI